MASLRDIRKRIKSAKSSEKITKAMKMVAASKLRRAQEEVKTARPFALKLGEVIAHLAMRLDAQGETPSPLLAPRTEKRKAELIVLTSDRGLCGAFNGNIIRGANRFLFEQGSAFDSVRVSTIGRKGYDSFRKSTYEVRKNYAGVLQHASFDHASDIADEVCKQFVSDELDAVYLAYNEFKSAISQKVVVKQMLPVVPAEIIKGQFPVDYHYEPSQQELLEELVPRYFATELFQAFLESLASEHGARMTAMDSASKNANEMISSLTLKYNRARQAAITRELVEIISGAEAL